MKFQKNNVNGLKVLTTLANKNYFLLKREAENFFSPFEWIFYSKNYVWELMMQRNIKCVKLSAEERREEA